MRFNGNNLGMSDNNDNLESKNEESRKELSTDSNQSEYTEDEIEDMVDEFMEDCPMTELVTKLVGGINPLGAIWSDSDKAEFLKGLGYRVIELSDEYGTVKVAVRDGSELPDDLDSPECDKALVSHVFANEYKEFTKKVVKKLQKWIEE